ALSTVAVTSCRIDGCVSDFTGDTVFSIQEDSVTDESTAETGPERNDNKIFHSLSGAVNHFTYSGGVGVVGDDCRDVKLFAEHFRQRNDTFPFQVCGALDRPFVVVSFGSSHTVTDYFVCERICGYGFGMGMRQTVEIILSFRSSGCGY